MNPPSVSVLIRMYTMERWPFILEAVRSSLCQTMPPKEIILVVDHNAELLARVQNEWQQHDQVIIVENSGERGSGEAWNSGIQAASGDIIAFLDDDAIAAPDWLEHLCMPYIDPNVVAVGGAIFPYWLAGRPTWFPEEFHWVVGCSYTGLPEQTAPVRNLIGCNMSFRRDILLEAGSFLKELGHKDKNPGGNEETELCIRVRQRNTGAVILHEPSARVRHMVTAERSRWNYFLRRCYLEGRSKAIVSGIVGREDGLSSEWKYTLKTLPIGFFRGFHEWGVKRDAGGIQRSTMIALGLAVTTASYVRTSIRLLIGP